jgi:protein-tyrosine phosphatase
MPDHPIPDPRYPMPLIDIHNHLLPAVDDGAKSLEESLRHLATLRAEGVERLAFSPHLNGNLATEPPGAVAERMRRLYAAFQEVTAATVGDDAYPVLAFSQEVLLPDAALVSRVLRQPRVGVAGGPYVLVEFGFQLPPDPLGVLRAVRAADRLPIVAHPERYRREGAPVPVEEIRQWRQAGALLQVNAGSLLGRYSASVGTLGWALLDAGLADLVASDHHADHRPVSPAAAARELEARGADAAARLLLYENPLRILEGRATHAVPALRQAAA